jgi:flagellar motor switch protein FliN
MTQPQPKNLTQVLTLEVPIIVCLGERFLRVSEVTALVPGSIIELPKTADEDLDLLVNNVRIGRGQAVKVGENFGIRLTRLGSPQELEADGTASVGSLPAEADDAQAA